MLSGHLQGRILSFISKIISPKNILEIGTYTGYSALCLAEGIQEDGQLITIDKDKKLFKKVNSFFKKSEFGKNIKQKVGVALDIIPTLDLKYDLVFIDADKKNYKNYFDLVLPMVNVGGIIIVDNVLWSGSVADLSNQEESTCAIRALNSHIHIDQRVEISMLPVGDGLTLVRKC